jgi:N-acetylmuramoyl-L-alanine amidase
MSIKVWLDAGHGGKDPGALGNNLKEKDINLAVTKEVNRILEKHGVTVGTTRTSDTFMELSDRSKKANDFKADILVSIHCNAFEDPSAQGVEVYHYPGSTKGKKLAQYIHDEVIKAKLYTKDRGVKSANFHMLRVPTMPCALIEMAFITNKQDAELLKNKQKEFALAIAKGILSYLGIKYVEPKKEKSKQGTGIIYRVQVGAYREKKNAENMVKKLKDKGFEAIIVTVKQ